MICAIHQPNFFPYYGFFKKIARSDIFVFLDDTQMPTPSKLGYLNHVSVNIGGVEQWMQAPLKSINYIKVKDAEFANDTWKYDAVEQIKDAYSKAEFYDENKAFIFKMLLAPENNLLKYNINFIVQLCLYLDIDKQFGRSSDKPVKARKSERLALLTKAFGCDTYLCGEGGEKYKGNSEFEKYGVNILVNNYNAPVYEPNKSLGLSNGLSVIDLLFRIGKNELVKSLKEK